MSMTVSEPRTRIHIFYDAASKSYVARIHRASGDVEWHDGFRSVQEAAVAAYDPLIEAAASDYQELARLMAEKTGAEEKLSALMEQWEALSLALEGEG